MDCRTVMKLNDRYLAEGLSDDVLSEYISHIETCESCTDNLMTDYSITKAIEQINRDQDFSTDYSKELMQKLARSRQYLLRKKRKGHYKRAIVAALMLLAIPCTAASTYATAKYYLPEGSTESYSLKHYGIPEESDPVKKAIREYNEEAITKLWELDKERSEDNGR